MPTINEVTYLVKSTNPITDRRHTIKLQLSATADGLSASVSWTGNLHGRMLSLDHKGDLPTVKTLIDRSVRSHCKQIADEQFEKEYWYNPKNDIWVRRSEV